MVGRSRLDADDPSRKCRIYLECLRSAPTQALYSEPSPVSFGSKASNSVGSSGSGVDIRLRLTGVNPNSEAMRIMISAWRLAIRHVEGLDRIAGRRLDHRPVFLDRLHRLGP